MAWEHRTIDIGDKETAGRLVVFQIMYPKRGSVLSTLGVWAATRKEATELALNYRNANHAGCPCVWRATIKREGN
jgi:hypothetical protein